MTVPSVERYLVFGDVAVQFTSPPTHRPRSWWRGSHRSRATGRRRWSTCGPSRPWPTSSPSCREPVAHPRSMHSVRPVLTWVGCTIAEPLRLHLTDGPVDPGALAPLLLLRCHRGAAGLSVEVLACTRLRAVGVVFARVARFEAAGDATLDALLSEALRVCTALRGHIVVEWQGWHTFEQGTEIEAKISLAGAPSIWSLASAITPLIGGPEFPGFIPDVGNEMQRWESSQQTFEVLAPASEVGYIAFVTSVNGTYSRQKKFVADGLRRQEIIRDPLPSSDAEAILAADYPDLVVRRLPDTTRARFDVNVESAQTGHFFGIEIDEVTESRHGTVLRQIEVEYHRSRIHDGLDGTQIDRELERLVALVQSYLDRRGVVGERNYYFEAVVSPRCRRPVSGHARTGLVTRMPRLAILGATVDLATDARGRGYEIWHVQRPGSDVSGWWSGAA